jgi:hypothetical protein
MIVHHPLASQPTRLVMAGDWHGDLDHAASVIGWAGREGAQAVVQLGDFGVWHGVKGCAYLDGIGWAATKAGVWAAFVDGNHENHEVLNALPLDDLGARPIRPALWHLPRGLRWTWHGQTWLALGGATSLDRPARKEGVNWWPEEAITYAQAAHAAALGHADVMLTHDCPAGVTVPGIPPDSFWPRAELDRANAHRRQLRAVVDVVKPGRLWHGHFHSAYTATLQGEDYTCQVTGLDDNTGPFHSNAVVFDLPVSPPE